MSKVWCQTSIIAARRPSIKMSIAQVNCMSLRCARSPPIYVSNDLFPHVRTKKGLLQYVTTLVPKQCTYIYAHWHSHPRKVRNLNENSTDHKYIHNAKTNTFNNPSHPIISEIIPHGYFWSSLLNFTSKVTNLKARFPVCFHPPLHRCFWSTRQISDSD